MAEESYVEFNENLEVQPDRTIYKGRDIEVLYDRKLCMHAAECGRGLKVVFDAKKRPWIDPDQAPSEQVAKVVMRCPSGALQFRQKDGKVEELEPAQNTILVSPDGPLFVVGDIVFHQADGTEHPASKRLALCRCGASNNKPYCDGTHAKIGFKDAGPVASDIEDEKGNTGRLTIKTVPNGPLLLSGPFTIRAASGREAFCGNKVALCRCGSAVNKPFCDGTHAKVGFRDSV
ncbi:MAG: CDGSH iron-sulfur domain-containing protein [Chroococcidiopsidaceae cyanobacterium CP_BM_ER_R8_30]|nr:CDGSH iron-sulfur domain-containing protein [Chroococcidiopsidaceae cyanobacterium CP_BM_ER_R8_30]